MLTIIMTLMLIKMSLFKQIDNEYFIRYIDLSKAEIVPLQLKIKNFYGALYTFTNNDRALIIENDNKELLKKLKRTWSKVIKLIGVDNAPDFVKTNLDDDSKFIEIDVLGNTAFNTVLTALIKIQYTIQ